MSLIPRSAFPKDKDFYDTPASLLSTRAAGWGPDALCKLTWIKSPTLWSPTVARTGFPQVSQVRFSLWGSRLSPLSPFCVSYCFLCFQGLSSATLAIGRWSFSHKIVFSGPRSLWSSFEILLGFFGRFPNDFKDYVIANNLVVFFLFKTPSTPVTSFLGLLSQTTAQIWWLKTTEMYYLAILGTKSLKGMCGQGHGPSEGSRGDFISCLSPSLWWPLVSLASLVLRLPSNLSLLFILLSSPGPSALLSPPFSYKDTSRCM